MPPSVRESGYDVRVTTEQPASGARCVEILLKRKPGRDGFGTILQSVEAAPLRGRHFRLTSKLRVIGGGRAQMWIRADRPHRVMGFFDNMDGRPVRAAEWTAAEISGVIDADAEAVTLGAMLIGDGTAWVDDFHFEVIESPAAGTAAEDGPNLLAGGDFEAGTAGWKPAEGTRAADWVWDKSAGRNGGGALCVHDHAATTGGAAVCSAWVEYVPKETALKISGWIRGKGLDAPASLGAQACLADGSTVLACATTRPSNALLHDFDWTYVETVLPATPRMERLAVFVCVEGRGDAWFDDLRVQATKSVPTTENEAARAPPPPPVPGLVLARGEFELCAGKPWSEPQVLIPLPLSYREQVPLTYELRTQPSGALARTRIYEDRPGNFVLEATFHAMKTDQTTLVSWESVVLCGERSFSDVPSKASIPPAWPEEAAPWLRSTWCVQSAHPRFVALAKELRRDTDDVMEIIRRIETRAAEIYSNAKGDVVDLTAVEALDKQGSCTSCANLVAALLRASGVPARVLSGYPLWSGPLQTHYIVEAFVPGYGWYPIESTMCRSPWQPYQQVEVSIVAPEHEDRAQRRLCAAGGVPYLSLDEIEGESGWTAGTIEGDEDCDHLAQLARALPTDGVAADWKRALDAARARWGRWLADAKLDATGRLATPLQHDAITSVTAADLALLLSK